MENHERVKLTTSFPAVSQSESSSFLLYDYYVSSVKCVLKNIVHFNFLCSFVDKVKRFLLYKETVYFAQ